MMTRNERTKKCLIILEAMKRPEGEFTSKLWEFARLCIAVDLGVIASSDALAISIDRLGFSRDAAYEILNTFNKRAPKNDKR